MSLRLAVFDCDGTLVDSQADICAAMDLAFSAVGMVPPDRHTTRTIVGLSLPQAMRRLLPDGDDADHAMLCESYRDAFRGRRAAGQLVEPLYAGMKELIERLHDSGWMLGVATGKSDRGLVSCLATHGLTKRFSTLQTADHHPSKPHPAMLQAALDSAGVSATDAVMIGDTSYDMEMARAAGVRAIGVTWGYHPEQELLDTGAQSVAHSIAELETLIGAL